MKNFNSTILFFLFFLILPFCIIQNSYAVNECTCEAFDPLGKSAGIEEIKGISQSTDCNTDLINQNKVGSPNMTYSNCNWSGVFDKKNEEPKTGCFCEKSQDNSLEFISNITVYQDCDFQKISQGANSGKYIDCQWSGSKENENVAGSESESNLLGSIEGISGLNKLKYSNIQTLLGGFIKTAMGIMGSIALIMVIYGGFLAMTAAGNAENVKKGAEILIWSTLGLTVIFASYMIVDLVFEAFR